MFSFFSSICYLFFLFIHFSITFFLSYIFLLSPSLFVSSISLHIHFFFIPLSISFLSLFNCTLIFPFFLFPTFTFLFFTLISISFHQASLLSFDLCTCLPNSSSFRKWRSIGESLLFDEDIHCISPPFKETPKSCSWSSRHPMNEAGHFPRKWKEGQPHQQNDLGMDAVGLISSDWK